jgi:hypothetical protein
MISCSEKVLDVIFCHKKLEIYLIFIIWNHGDYGTLFFFNTHECQETQIKNPFDSILGFDLIKDFWNWNFLSLKKDIFTKDFQRTHIIKIWNDNNLLNTLKIFTISKPWNLKILKIQNMYIWKFRISNFKSVLSHVNGV